MQHSSRLLHAALDADGSNSISETEFIAGVRIFYRLGHDVFGIRFIEEAENLPEESKDGSGSGSTFDKSSSPENVLRWIDEAMGMDCREAVEPFLREYVVIDGEKQMIQLAGVLHAFVDGIAEMPLLTECFTR